MEDFEMTSDAADGVDGDTEVFTEADLALFGERGRSEAAGEKRGAPWARLVSVDKSYPNIEIWGEEVNVGRSDVLKTNGKVNFHVSQIHVKISSSPNEKLCAIQDLSVNGTLVQGVAVGKDQRVPLHHGDEICLGPESSGCPKYVFQLLTGVNHRQQETAIAAVNAVVKNTFEVNDEGSAPKRLKVNAVDSRGAARPGDFETFKCSICLNIWHDVVSVTPCLHSFCNACFSNWYRKARQDRTECKCPECRAKVTSVGRNHMLRSLVEDFLFREPSLDRTPEEKTELQQMSIFDRGQERKFNFGSANDNDEYRSQSSADLSDQSSDDNSEHHDELCCQCPGRRPDGEQEYRDRFCCQPGQLHLICGSCGLFFPCRDDIGVPQICQSCSSAFCKTYFATQNEDSGHGRTCQEIIPLNVRTVPGVPRKLHRGNAYEQEVTKRYMDEQGLSFENVIAGWLPKLDSGEAGQPQLSLPITSQLAVCDYCAEVVHAHLLDKYRRTILRTELPPDAAGRPDCWYGDQCRTQFHRDSHARKCNHVCDPTRQSTQRS